MAQDNKIITSLSPADLVVLLRETAGIAVLESAVADGRPVIQAAVKAMNAQTGEVLAGGLPFSVVMFKSGNEPGYSNIAIGTVVPAAELNIHLPPDYFSFCNQRLRFVRIFPLDPSSFVIQMDLVLRNATREYVKFNFGLWGMLFKQVLFELIGSGRDSLVRAAEVYAATATAQHYVAAVNDQSIAEHPASAEPPLAPSAEIAIEAQAPQTLPEAAILTEDGPQAEVSGLAAETIEAVPQAAVPGSSETHAFDERSENVMMLADPVEGKDEAPEDSLAEEGFAVTLLDKPLATAEPVAQEMHLPLS